MEQHTQVLVVGAGPVGLLAALELHERGIGVIIVDEKDQCDARSYAVVLHPRVLRALIDRGLSEPLIWQGCPLKRIAVFCDGEKHATLELPAASELSAGGLSLPQNVLRRALESALRDRGVEVRYGHRLASLDGSVTSVRAALIAANGAPLSVQADFVIGADGRDSAVRNRLGIELLPKRPSETYAFFDVPRDPRAGNQVEIVLTSAFNSAMIPLHAGMSRYAFQIPESPQRTPDLSLLAELLAARMPWHKDELERVEWSAIREFRYAVVDRFGKGSVWLAGDAAHATNPLGVQSLNVGLCEARELAEAIGECVRGAPPELLGLRYETRRRTEWNRLLGSDPKGGLTPRVPEWIRRHLARLISCLPASGDDLDDLLDQLRVSLP